MKIPKNVLTVLILHRSLKWSKVSLSSFLEIFDGYLVVIDNNFKKDNSESEYVKNTFGITPLFNNKSSKRFCNLFYGFRKWNLNFEAFSQKCMNYKRFGHKIN